ncbi:UNVERIFIED_CONTAM: UDP-glucuronate 4-epimerase 1 [Sesamum radiatum]|uniref:UDP-glucuronate 4-epimerase 1 n=1 Tax=Sesamum radiatum TaxID=300843 RepID=A0AAW2LDU6_SESRA
MRSSAEEELFLPSTPGKFKDRSHAMHRQFHRCFASTSTMFLWALFLVALTAAYLSFQSFVDSGSRYFSSAWGGIHWEKQVRSSAQIHRQNGFSVLVTGAAGFVGTHVSLALKKRGDGVVGLDNFNNYYDPALKRARRDLLSSHNIFIVEGDVNDARMLAKLFEIVAFTHVMHLAAQAGVRYAMENPHSYVHSNIAGLVTLLEACKNADPQPAIVWASSSSVYGLNEKTPFSESDLTDRPASLYAATKKAGEEITHTYNHIYGLSITGLRFFTVYGPWGRPDMAYFSFIPETKENPNMGKRFGGRHSEGVRGVTGHGKEEYRVGWEETAAGSVSDLQFGEHVAGDGADDGGHTGEATETEGEEEDGGNAGKRRRSVHAREYKLGPEGIRVQAHNRFANRVEKVR